MFAYKSRQGLAMKRKQRFKSQNSNMTVDTDLDNFGTLKKEVKRIEILTRMENRAKTSINAGSYARPSTQNNRRSSKPRPNDFGRIEQQYFKEKSLMRTTLQQPKKQRQNEHGLLGQRRRYEQFSKDELIQKLISLEHLANTIFKKNKHLEEQIQKLKKNANNE